MGPLWLLYRQGRPTGARTGGVTLAARLVGPTSTLVREQLASPGQRLAGLRTVDRRTGRRVALWRTLALFGASVGGHWLARWLAPAARTRDQKRERERVMAELGSVYERGPDDPASYDPEHAQLRKRRSSSPQVSHWRALASLAAPLAAGLATTWLRRRLAPTVEVLTKRQSP